MSAPNPKDRVMASGDALPRIDIDGLPFVACDVDTLAAHICSQVSDGVGGWVVTPNIDILRRWRREASFRELVREASVFTADGKPIVWASQLQGTPLPGRLTGSDLFLALYKRAARAGLRMALIGGNEGAADAAVKQLEAEASLPSGVTRTHCPPMGFERKPEELRAMDALLASWQPHIVFVGLGSPKQETLIRALRLQLPQAWYLGVGVSFSFVAGDVKRAPRWMQASGTEWLHRLTQEPGRLARRYLVDGIPFAVGLLARSLYKRITNTASVKLSTSADTAEK